jgi:hypothetical protein
MVMVGMVVARTRGNAVRREGCVRVWAVVGMGTLDVSVCVRRCGRVRLGGHDPSERRKRGVDVGRSVLMLFFHVRRELDVVVGLGRGKRK